MRKFSKLLVLAMAAVLLITCDTEKDLDSVNGDFFVKYYGDTGNQEGVDMVVNSDGTIFLLGNSFDEVAKNRILLVKIDAFGEILGKFYYGNGGEDFAVDIEPIAGTTNFVILGYRKVAANDIDAQLIEITTDGTVVREKLFGVAGETDTPRSVTPLADGGFIVTGQTSARANTGTDQNPILDELPNVFIYRFESDFQTNANFTTKPIGRNGVEDGIKVIEISPNSFNLFMSSNATNLGGNNFNFYFLNLDNEGDPQGAKTLLDNANNLTDEILKDVSYLPGVGYCLLGTISSTAGSTPKNAYLIVLGPTSTPVSINQLNSGNETVSPINLEGEIEGVSVAPALKNNGFLVLANQAITTSGTLNNNMILMKLNFQGVPIGDPVSFGAEYFDAGAKVLELTDGRILVLGTVTLGNQEKIVLIKVNSEGQFAK